MNLRRVINHLKDGGLVIYPTETAYGLGADPGKARAVRRIFALKGRVQSKSLPLIAASLGEAERIARFGKTARLLAKNYWPGPLTLVLPVRSNTRLARGVADKGRVAIRVSSHPMARDLARGVGGLIISTSANRSGRPACYSISEIRKQFGRLPDDLLIVDGGTIPRRKSSTIVKVDGRRVEVIRVGSKTILMQNLRGREDFASDLICGLVK